MGEAEINRRIPAHADPKTVRPLMSSCIYVDPWYLHQGLRITLVTLCRFADRLQAQETAFQPVWVTTCLRSWPSDPGTTPQFTADFRSGADVSGASLRFSFH